MEKDIKEREINSDLRREERGHTSVDSTRVSADTVDRKKPSHSLWVTVRLPTADRSFLFGFHGLYVNIWRRGAKIYFLGDIFNFPVRYVYSAIFFSKWEEGAMTPLCRNVGPSLIIHKPLQVLEKKEKQSVTKITLFIKDSEVQ